MIGTLLRFRLSVLPSRRALLLGALLTVVEVGVSLALPWPLSAVIDDVLVADPRPDDAQLRIGLAVGSLLVLVLFGSLVNYWASRLLSSAGLHIAADLFAQIGDFVDEGDLGRQKGVGRVFDDFRAAPACELDGASVDIKRAVNLLHDGACPIVLRAYDDSVGAFEVADSRTLA